MDNGETVRVVETPTRKPIPIEIPQKPERKEDDPGIAVPNWPVPKPVEVPAEAR